ncbi:MAG: hypothetical protein QXO19_03100 [Candidatus Aenigmatarchaeota archaeon]
MNVIKIGGSVLYENENINVKLFNEIFNTVKNEYNIFVIGCGKKLHDLTIKYNLTDTSKNNNIKIKEKHAEEINNLLKKNLEKIDNKKLVKYLPNELFEKKSTGNKNHHEINKFHNEKIENYIKEYFILITGGIVKDLNLGYCAISSDTIAGYLANYYNAKNLLILTDTNGILKNNENVKEIFLNEKYEFITGEMENKLRRLRNTITNNINIKIANGFDISNLEKILKAEKDAIYTEIKVL